VGQDGRVRATRTARSSDGVVVAVHDLGGRGRPVLLAHATGFHGRVWAPLARHLSDRASCWSLDFRGHGDTPPPTGRGFEWEGFADDLLAVVDEVGLDGAVGVGHSKGGAALVMAEARRPGTFAGLWLYEPIVFPPAAYDPVGEGVDHPLAEGAMRRRPSFPSYEEALANFASKEPMAALDPEALREYVEHGFAPGPDGEVHLKCKGEWEAQVYRMGGRHGGWDALPSVRCPAVVACGGDGGPPATVAPAVAERLAARLERFDDLAHFGPLEDPARIAARVAVLLDEVDRPLSMTAT
jgi:pimeloyl-ACP methyl ester carboxylesterase